MTIEEMKAKKSELGYTNETVSKLSGVPLGTVQKIFAGETKAPRYDTVQKLTKVLQSHVSAYVSEADSSTSMVSEVSAFAEYGKAAPLRDTHSGPANAYIKPPKKKLGIADGKYRMPSDELLFSDEIPEMFEDL